MICEIMNDDGTMARRAELEVFAQEHGIKIGTIADLIHYRMIHERTIERVSTQVLDSELGTFNLVTYRESNVGDVHLALTLGTISLKNLPWCAYIIWIRCVICLWSSKASAGACVRPWLKWPKPAVVWCCYWVTK